MSQNNHDTITLAIVEDHPVVIEGLQKLLATESHIEIVGCFTKGAHLLSYMKENKTDLVLLDIGLPDAHGIDLCREIKVISPATCILVLTNHNERSIIMQMLQSGASGYLLKNTSGPELVQAINDACQGQIVFSREVKEIIARPQADETKRTPQLTKREKEILRLIADGNTTAQIAEQLFLSPLTIETHRRNLMQKFEVKNVAALIKIAVGQKLI